MMKRILEFTISIGALSFIHAALSRLVPAGHLKSTTLTALGLLYIAAVLVKIMGIFDGLGV